MDQVEGSFGYNTFKDGLLIGDIQIKKIIESTNHNDNSKINKILKQKKKNTQAVLFIAPFRTSSDLHLESELAKIKNTVLFSFTYHLSTLSLAVLNQKFYFGVFSNNCLLEFKTLPILDEHYQRDNKINKDKKITEVN